MEERKNLAAIVLGGTLVGTESGGTYAIEGRGVTGALSVIGPTERDYVMEEKDLRFVDHTLFKKESGSLTPTPIKFVARIIQKAIDTGAQAVIIGSGTDVSEELTAALSFMFPYSNTPIAVVGAQSSGIASDGASNLFNAIIYCMKGKSAVVTVFDNNIYSAHRYIKTDDRDPRIMRGVTAKFDTGLARMISTDIDEKYDRKIDPELCGIFSPYLAEGIDTTMLDAGLTPEILEHRLKSPAKAYVLIARGAGSINKKLFKVLQNYQGIIPVVIAPLAYSCSRKDQETYDSETVEILVNDNPRICCTSGMAQVSAKVKAAFTIDLLNNIFSGDAGRGYDLLSTFKYFMVMPYVDEHFDPDSPILKRQQMIALEKGAMPRDLIISNMKKLETPTLPDVVHADNAAIDTKRSLDEIVRLCKMTFSGEKEIVIKG